MIKLRIFLILFFIFIISEKNAFSVTTWYACASGGNWNGANVWTSVEADQTTCVASTGNPAAGDTAELNSTSGNITISATAACATIDETGYTNTLAFGTQTLTLTAASNLGGAMTSTSGTIITTGNITLLSTPTGSFPTIDFNGSLTFASGGYTWPGNIAITSGSKTFTMNGNMIVGGSLSLVNSAGANQTFSGNYNLTIGTLTNPANDQGWTLTFPASQTLTITTAISTGGPGTLKSGTSSTSMYLDYTGALTSENISGWTMTDVNASGSTDGLVYDYFAGTLTRTTDVDSKTAANFSSGSGNGYAY